MTPYRQMRVEIWTVLTRSCRLGQFLSGCNVERCNTKAMRSFGRCTHEMSTLVLMVDNLWRTVR